MAQRFTNNAVSSLAAAVSTLSLTVTLAEGHGEKFPALANDDFFLITVFQRIAGVESNYEIMRCTARNSDVLTVERAQEETPRREYNIGDAVELRLTAGSLRAPEDGYAVGDVMFSAAPKGKKFLPADGRVYSQYAYPELFAAIGVGHVFPSVMLDHQYYCPANPMAISYSSDGKYLICAYSNRDGKGMLLGKRDGNTYTIVSSNPMNNFPQTAKFVPNSNYIVVCDESGLRLFHAENDVIYEIPSAYEALPEGAFTIGFSEDGKKFALGGGTQTYAYSLVNEKFSPLEVYGESGSSTIAFAAMSPDGTFIVSAHNGASNLRAFFWDANTQRYDRMGTNWGDINTDYTYGSTVKVVITKDQNYIISCWDGAPYLHVHRRNGFEFTAVDNLNIVKMQGNGIAVSVNEDYIAVSGNTPPYLAAYSYEDGVISKLSMESFSPPKIPTGVEFSPDGAHLAMLYTNGTNYNNPDKNEKVEILHSLLPYDHLFEFQVPNNKPTPGRVESTSKIKAYIKAKP